MKNKVLPLTCSLALLAIAVSAGRAACCYFAAKDKDILQPGQKAFITWNAATKMESFTVQPKFQGNASDFGMVIPTPGRPKLDEMPRDFFKDLAIYTILMPTPEPIYPPQDPSTMRYRGFGGMLPPVNMGAKIGGLNSVEFNKNKVRVIEAGVVGSLDYKIILAEDPKGLFDWLKENKYSYGGDTATLDFYIKRKSYFTVMKIDPKQMKKDARGNYTGEVTPTRFSFASTQCFYPLKITQISVKDKTDALFYVQSDREMDLPAEWSWMHSYRPMYLTYMLGCSTNAAQQKELNERTQWLQTKKSKTPGYETTKLEWAKKLGDVDLSVLSDPQTNYSRMGTGSLPPGAKVVSLDEMLNTMKKEIEQANKNKLPDWAKPGFSAMEDKYQPASGTIVENPPGSYSNGGYIYTRYTWYPARQVPLDDIKGLVRLKGHLQKGQWLTKFRKEIRKNEMTQDLVLAAVPTANEQEYIRIMPTSPP